MLNHQHLKSYSNSCSIYRINRFIITILSYLFHFITERKRPAHLEQALITLPSENKNIHLPYRSIMYVQAKEREVYIFLTDQTRLIISMPMYLFLRLLPCDCFIRVHKSYIVSKPQIRSYNCHEVSLSDHSIIPVGRIYTTWLWQQMFGDSYTMI